MTLISLVLRGQLCTSLGEALEQSGLEAAYWSIHDREEIVLGLADRLGKLVSTIPR